MACRGGEVAGQTLDRKVEGSSPDKNIIGYHQEGHPDIKWLTAPSKSPDLHAGTVQPPILGKIDHKTIKKNDRHRECCLSDCDKYENREVI